MPADTDLLNAVTRLFPEIAKNAAEFFVNVKVHGVTVFALYAVNTPITVPGGALFFTVELLILMVISLSGRRRCRLGGPCDLLQIEVNTFASVLI